METPDSIHDRGVTVALLDSENSARAGQALFMHSKLSCITTSVLKCKIPFKALFNTLCTIIC